jgi:hypothetical protein
LLFPERELLLLLGCFEFDLYPFVEIYLELYLMHELYPVHEIQLRHYAPSIATGARER